MLKQTLHFVNSKHDVIGIQVLLGNVKINLFKRGNINKRENSQGNSDWVELNTNSGPDKNIEQGK